MTSSGQRSAHAEASPFQIMGGSGSKTSNSRSKYAITSSRLRKPHATRVKRPSKAAALTYSSAFAFSTKAVKDRIDRSCRFSAFYGDDRTRTKRYRTFQRTGTDVGKGCRRI